MCLDLQERKENRQQAEYCQSSVTYQGRSIVDSCPVACGFPINDPASDTASDYDDDLSPTDDAIARRW